jgi:Glycosyl hydrolase family 26
LRGLQGGISIAAAVVLGAALTTISCSSASGKPAAALCPSTVGVYVGPAAPQKVIAFERWSGHSVDCVLDFLASDSWRDISTPSWWLTRWSADPERDHHHLVLSVPLLPESGADMANGASGHYDHYFSELADLLVRTGFSDATIRLGWEFNGKSFPWAVHVDGGTDSPTNFVEYWRHVVQAMRAVTGSRFTFDWTVNNGKSDFPPELAYPGDDVVDVVSVDAYDQVWGAYGSQVIDPAERWRSIASGLYGLDYWANFARLHRKPIGVPEWGVMQGGHGLGDNPHYVEHMFNWMTNNHIVYQMYFDASNSIISSGAFPHAAEAYRAGIVQH